jgi:hypothetical protein
MSIPFQPGTQLSCVAVGPYPVNSGTIPTQTAAPQVPTTVAPTYQTPIQTVQPIQQQNPSTFNVEVTIQSPYNNVQYSTQPQQQSIYNQVQQYPVGNQSLSTIQTQQPLQQNQYLNTSNPCLNVQTPQYNQVQQYPVGSQTLSTVQTQPLQQNQYLNTSNPCLNVQTSQYNQQPAFQTVYPQQQLQQQIYNQQPQFNSYQNNLRSSSLQYTGFNNNTNNYDPCLQQNNSNNLQFNNNKINNNNQFNSRSSTSSPIEFHEEVIPLTDEQYSSMSRLCNNNMNNNLNSSNLNNYNSNFNNLNSYGSQNSLYNSQPNLYTSQSNLYNSQPNFYGSQQSLNLINNQQSSYGLSNLNQNYYSNQSLYNSQPNLHNSQPNLYNSQPNNIYSSQPNLYNPPQYQIQQSSNLLNNNCNISQGSSLYNQSNLSSISSNYQNFNNNPYQLSQPSQASSYFTNNQIPVLSQPSQTSNYFSNGINQLPLSQSSQTSNFFTNNQIPVLPQSSQTSTYLSNNNNPIPSINYNHQNLDWIQPASNQTSQIPPLIAPTTTIPANSSSNYLNTLPTSLPQQSQPSTVPAQLSSASLPITSPSQLLSTPIQVQQPQINPAPPKSTYNSFLKDSRFQQNEESMLRDVIDMYNREAAAKLASNPKNYLLSFRKDFHLTQVEDHITFGDGSGSQRQSIIGTPNISRESSPITVNGPKTINYYPRERNQATLSSGSIDSRQSTNLINSSDDNTSAINKREYRAPPVAYQNTQDKGRSQAFNDSSESSSFQSPPSTTPTLNRSTYRAGPTITEITDLKSNDYKPADNRLRSDSSTSFRNIDNKTPVSGSNDPITIPEVRRPPNRNDNLKEVEESLYKARLNNLQEDSSRANNNNTNNSIKRFY